MKFSWKIGSVGNIRSIYQHELIEILLKIMGNFMKIIILLLKIES